MEFKEIIKYEKKKYFSSNKDYIKNILVNSDDYQIWKFQKLLRRTEYYKCRKSFIDKFLYIFFKRCKNISGRRLGFNISEGCFLEGLRIYHIGAITVNPAARIGRNCIIVGNVCIGNVNGLNIAPKIGDNCMFGWGSTAIGDISIADNSSIAAGAVVVKNIEKEFDVVAGIPARSIKK